MSRRHGLSLVEVLLAIGIVVLLIGLLLPALVRHRGRDGIRPASVNNLKQIALAVHNYAGAYGDKLPPLVDVAGIPGSPTGAGLRSLFFNLLPYVEREDVYYLYSAAQPGSYYMPAGAAQVILKVFVSPADVTASNGTTTPMPVSLPYAPPAPFAQSFTGTYAATSYAANGLIPWATGGLPESFRDGTSNTILFAERAQVCDNGTTKTYNLWGYGLYGPSMPAFAALTPDSPEGLASTGQLAPATPSPNDATTFAAAGNKPNSVSAKHGRVSAMPTEYTGAPFQVAPRGAVKCDPSIPQTPHIGGMLVGLGDGSVRSVSPSITLWTFWAACTPAGKETLYVDWTQ